MPGNTREQLLDFVRGETKRMAAGNYGFLHAGLAAERLNISRNLASQYLNQWSAEGKVVKIDSRPVCFIHRQCLEEMAGIKLKQTYFNDMEEFETLMRSSSQGFQSLIGYDSSLGDCIEQLKIAAHYPPYGLSAMLLGEKGTGKSLLCSIFFRYMHSANLISGEARLLRITFHSDQKRNEETVTRLFHSKEGMIRQDTCGVIVLEKFHRLERQLQNRIFDQLSQRGKEIFTGWRFLFTAEPAEAGMMDFWKSRITVVAECPRLHQRPGEEKEQLVLRFFTREEQLVRKNIRVSQRVFAHLCRYHFPTNIDGLEGEIKKICAKAYLYQRGEEVLSVYSGYFSDELLAGMEVGPEIQAAQWIYPAEREISGGNGSVFGLSEEVYGMSAKYLSGEADGGELAGQVMQDLQNQLSRYPYIDDEESPQRRHSIMVLCENLAAMVEGRFGCVLPKRFIRMITELLQKQIAGVKERPEREADAIILQEKLYEYLPGEKQAAEYFCRLVETNLGCCPEPVIRIRMISGIRYYNRQMQNRQISAVIICHGQSTATSMADAVNSLFGRNLFEALDMPFDTTVEKIGETLRHYINNRCVLKRVIILVDMGSLELIYESLQHLPGMQIGIINHVSTNMAVHVGDMILEGKEIRDILKEAAGASAASHRLIELEKKESGVLFIGEKNTEIAVKLKDLFWNSIPRETALRPILWNCEEGKTVAQFAADCGTEILFTLGISQHGLDGVPHLELSEVITLDKNKKVYEQLQWVLTDSEIQLLLKNLLRNFSLQNIMQQLTILNPEPLTSRIEVSLELLQNYLNMTFKPNTLMGLYLHLSYLIERLVTKNPIDDYENLEQFALEQKAFTDICKKSFRNVEAQYHVDIPLSEIAYIFDYVRHNEDLRKWRG